MRRFACLLVLGWLTTFGCTTNQTAPYGPVAPLKTPSKTLAIAFDDIPAQIADMVPLGLTASDGTGLKLVSVKARAVIDDPLAFTELQLTFENPEDRVLEGTFQMVLPQGAAISRFAMKNAAGFQEGEVVEKQRARQVYEDFLHRKQDPALLEQAAGNEFSARVFPIPARGQKELIVSYSQELSKAKPYSLPLKGLPEIGRLDVEAYVAGRAAPVASINKQGVTPQEDLTVSRNILGDRVGVRNGNLVLARVTPIVASQPEPLTDTLILVDTSASRALGMVEQGRVVQKLCEQLGRASGGQNTVLVAAYDQTIEPIFSGFARDFGKNEITQIRQRLALGASNLEAALSWAAEHAARNTKPRSDQRPMGRIVVVTDGVPTAGETSGEKLRERVLSLSSAGIKRLDAVLLGGIRDDDLMKSLVNSGLPQGGIAIEGSTQSEELWRRLNEATRSNIDVKVEEATFTFPQKVDGVQAGDEVLVYANVPEDKPVRISVGGSAFAPVDLVKVERPMLERAWVGAKIKSLVERERVEGSSDMLSKEIIGLSTQYRVLSPKTSLLVLETEWDYQRFGINRRALTDVLVTDGPRVALLKRTLPDPPKPPVVVATKPPPVAPSKPKSKPQTGGWTGGTAGAAAPQRPSNGAQPAMKELDEVGGDGEPDFSPSAPGVAPRPDPTPPPQSRRAELQRPPTERAPGGGGQSSLGSSRGAPAATASPMAGPRPAPTATARPTNAAPSPEPAQRNGSESSDDARSPRAAAGAAAPPPPPRDSRPSPARERRAEISGEEESGSDIPKTAPYTGPFKAVMDLVSLGNIVPAIQAAFEWRKTAPGDVMALVALGEGFEAAGDQEQAARCYGSLVDLFPGRADLRRFAGERLERLTHPAALDLAADTYGKAEVERPDHPASHRLYAFALLKKGLYEKAFEAIVRGLHQRYPEGRFRGADRILSEDLGLVGAAWAKADPSREEEIQNRIRKEGGLIESEPSLRFVLNWETDANDVDFHIYDGEGGHAFYSRPSLDSGGSLYADVTTGYGPECFTIRQRSDVRKGPYRLQAHYYSRGPMGYGMGKLQIIDHDGRGGLVFEERPFVVMVDRAFVDLGVVKR